MLVCMLLWLRPVWAALGHTRLELPGPLHATLPGRNEHRSRAKTTQRQDLLQLEDCVAWRCSHLWPFSMAAVLPVPKDISIEPATFERIHGGRTSIFNAMHCVRSITRQCNCRSSIGWWHLLHPHSPYRLQHHSQPPELSPSTSAPSLRQS